MPVPEQLVEISSYAYFLFADVQRLLFLCSGHIRELKKNGFSLRV
jgi:hypothetical protein